jgi:hypothetical protein
VASPVVAPIPTIVVDEPQESMVPVVPTRFIVQESVPVILTMPSNIIVSYVSSSMPNVIFGEKNCLTIE